MRSYWTILLAGVLASFAARGQEIINGLHVAVNDSIITVHELREYIRPQLEALERDLVGEPERLKKQRSELDLEATRDLLVHRLTLHDYEARSEEWWGGFGYREPDPAKRAMQEQRNITGYQVPASLVEDRIQRDIKKNYGDRATLIKTLRDRGSSYEAYRRQQAERVIVDLMMDNYQQRLAKDLIVSPQKVADYYATNRPAWEAKMDTNWVEAAVLKVRMIMLKKPADETNGRTVRMAQEIRENIKQGASFEQMSRTGPNQAQDGVLEYKGENPLRKELMQAVASLKPGECTEVVDLPGECWLVQVVEKKPTRAKPLTEVSPMIEREFMARETAHLMDRWFGRLTNKACIIYYGKN
jgi:hypothetical protein